MYNSTSTIPLSTQAQNPFVININDWQTQLQPDINWQISNYEAILRIS